MLTQEKPFHRALRCMSALPPVETTTEMSIIPEAGARRSRFVAAVPSTPLLCPLGYTPVSPIPRSGGGDSQQLDISAAPRLSLPRANSEPTIVGGGGGRRRLSADDGDEGTELSHPGAGMGVGGSIDDPFVLTFREMPIDVRCALHLQGANLLYHGDGRDYSPPASVIFIKVRSLTGPSSQTQIWTAGVITTPETPIGEVPAAEVQSSIPRLVSLNSIDVKLDVDGDVAVWVEVVPLNPSTPPLRAKRSGTDNLSCSNRQTAWTLDLVGSLFLAPVNGEDEEGALGRAEFGLDGGDDFDEDDFGDGFPAATGSHTKWEDINDDDDEESEYSDGEDGEWHDVGEEEEDFDEEGAVDGIPPWLARRLAAQGIDIKMLEEDGDEDDAKEVSDRILQSRASLDRMLGNPQREASETDKNDIVQTEEEADIVASIVAENASASSAKLTKKEEKNKSAAHLGSKRQKRNRRD